MSVVDDYMRNVEPAMRAEMERIRSIALSMLPGAVETISYGMPTIKFKDKSIIGFDAHKNHVGIYPFSGSVISEIEELDKYAQTKGALREKLDDPLPDELIKKIIEVRLNKAFN